MEGYTKHELIEMWKRPVERQYNIAMTKIMKAIFDTKGEISLCFSGGKDSALMLDMYCECVCSTEYANKPIKVYFANTTNETSNMRCFIKDFIAWIENKYRVKIDFQETRPKDGLTWAQFVLNKGIPLISKAQSKAIRYVKRDIKKTGCDYETVKKMANPEMKCVKELLDIGFSKSGVLSLTGYVFNRQEFGNMFRISKKWLPMVMCDIDLTEQCCVRIKEEPLHRLAGGNVMVGEQAEESATREQTYLKTGCNIRLPNGDYKAKPFGPMTKDGILYAIKFRGTPICKDYGDIVQDDDGHYRCTKAQRTGCALCGFGCQYDTDRFIRLQETDPAKVKFAFKPKSEGGAGYKEAIEYMNENCGTKVVVPKV